MAATPDVAAPAPGAMEEPATPTVAQPLAVGTKVETTTIHLALAPAPVAGRLVDTARMIHTGEPALEPALGPAPVVGWAAVIPMGDLALEAKMIRTADLEPEARLEAGDVAAKGMTRTEHLALDKAVEPPEGTAEAMTAMGDPEIRLAAREEAWAAAWEAAWVEAWAEEGRAEGKEAMTSAAMIPMVDPETRRAKDKMTPTAPEGELVAAWVAARVVEWAEARDRTIRTETLLGSSTTTGTRWRVQC